MAKTRFYLGDFQQYFRDKETQSSTRFYKIHLMEGSGYDSGYVHIDTIFPTPGKEFVETTKVSDDFLNKWYRFEFFGKSEDEKDFKLGVSEPTVPEDLGSILDDVRGMLGDTNIASPAFSDREYINSIRFALKQYKGDKNFTNIREEDIIPIQLLVRIEFCMIIAYDHAQYYALQAPSASLDKSQIMNHYLEMARSLENHYDSIANRLGISSGGKNNDGIIHEMPAPNVGNMKRFSATSGLFVDNIEPSKYYRRNLLG
jgi:hypothetical protein